MSSFLDRFGRNAVDQMQLDTAGCDPLVADDFPALVERGPADSFAALLAADDVGTEDDDAYWRELHLRQLAEGGGVDHDDDDPSNWIHRRVGPAIEADGGLLTGALERLEADFAAIIGRRLAKR
jgi:hypothetical protein